MVHYKLSIFVWIKVHILCGLNINNDHIILITGQPVFVLTP